MNLRLGRQSFHSSCNLGWKRGVFKITTVHATNNGWDIVSRRVLPYEIQSNTGTKQARHYNVVLV